MAARFSRSPRHKVSLVLRKRQSVGYPSKKLDCHHEILDFYLRFPAAKLWVIRYHNSEEAMRSYPIDSKEAVCRLLALSMIVDGHMAPSELKAMEHSAILERVGADAEAFDTVLQALCEDMLASASREAGAEIELDRNTLDRLFEEIADPLLRMCTLKAMLDIVHADQHLDSREHLLLQRALKRWSAPADGAMRLRAG